MRSPCPLYGAWHPMNGRCRSRGRRRRRSSPVFRHPKSNPRPGGRLLPRPLETGRRSFATHGHRLDRCHIPHSRAKGGDTEQAQTLSETDVQEGLTLEHQALERFCKIRAGLRHAVHCQRPARELSPVAPEFESHYRPPGPFSAIDSCTLTQRVTEIVALFIRSGQS